jgi:hypothetical protein
MERVRIKLYKNIHPAHSLSDCIYNSGYYFFVLNPEKLKTMIETIYEQGDEIVIFTAGLWLQPVLSIISIQCHLTADDHARFNQSLLLNPQHDSSKLRCQLAPVRTLLKGYRLHGLFRTMPELREKHFVLLDNDLNHINSCTSCSYLDGVLASTNTDDLSFYDKVIETMRLAHTEWSGLSPSSLSYHYPQEILKALIQLEEDDSTKIQVAIST